MGFICFPSERCVYVCSGEMKKAKSGFKYCMYINIYIYIWISDMHIYTHGERYKESVRKQNSMRILLKSQLKVIGKNMK